MANNTTLIEDKMCDIFLAAYNSQLNGQSISSQMVFICRQLILLMNEMKKFSDLEPTPEVKTCISNGLILVNLVLIGTETPEEHNSFQNLSQMEKKRIRHELLPLVMN